MRILIVRGYLKFERTKRGRGTCSVCSPNFYLLDGIVIVKSFPVASNRRLEILAVPAIA